MNQVFDRTHKIRYHVNHPWKRELIFSDIYGWL